MEEVESTKEASEETLDSLSMLLAKPEMNEKITLTLTRGELTVINAFIKSHLQTKGYEMIFFAHNLFNSLDAVLGAKETKEAFE